MADPLRATVVGIDGKYHFINKGKRDAVQVGDVFERGGYINLFDPETKQLLHDEDDPAFAPYGELYVERVFDRYSAAVPIYELQTPDSLKVGDEVTKGHPHRVTPYLGLLNSPGKTG